MSSSRRFQGFSKPVYVTPLVRRRNPFIGFFSIELLHTGSFAKWIKKPLSHLNIPAFF
jgi:hypothetical protein